MKIVNRKVGTLVLLACCMLLCTVAVSTVKTVAYAQEPTESTTVDTEVIDTIEAELQEQGESES